MEHGRSVPTGLEHPRVDVRRMGKGRLALCKDATPDPFMVARDTHMLLGRAYDVARFFNLSAFLSIVTASRDGETEAVQITSFAIRYPNDLATAWVPGKYASARLWSLGAAGPVAIETVPENGEPVSRCLPCRFTQVWSLRAGGLMAAGRAPLQASGRCSSRGPVRLAFAGVG